jgi:hypothetical protein
MIKQLLRILNEAIRQVPAMKYALAVAGILAVVAFVGAFRISPPVAAFGAVIILVLMVAMVVFARLTTVGRRTFLVPAQVMMWSFLLLIIATAFLLLTCAFFQWPKPLDKLTGRGGGGTSNGGDATNSPPARVFTLIQAARLQLAADDYAGAWGAITEAVGLAPDFAEARQEQVEIALAWLRNMRVTLPATFTEAVKPLVECLYQALAQEKGTRAADIHAHVGWANAMKWRETGSKQGIETEYAEAVKLDPTNPYAHAMWGHWLATQWKPLAEITNHFHLAHQSGRAPEFVAYLEIYALGWDNDDGWRRARIDPGNEARDKIFAVVYEGHGRKKHTDEVVAMLPATEHLATFLWVAGSRDWSGAGAAGYFHARLTEATGDKTKALTLYRSIKPYSSYESQIEEGIARCQQ